METSVLQDCIAEAKLLVDTAYNRTQKRWGWGWECADLGGPMGRWALAKVLSSNTHPWVPLLVEKTPFSILSCPRPHWAGVLLVTLHLPPASFSSLGQHQAAPSQRLGQPHGPPGLLQAANSNHQDSCSGCRLYACGLRATGKEATPTRIQTLQCHWYYAPY